MNTDAVFHSKVKVAIPAILHPKRIQMSEMGETEDDPSKDELLTVGQLNDRLIADWVADMAAITPAAAGERER